MRLTSIVLVVLYWLAPMVGAAPRRRPAPPTTYAVPSAVAPGKTTHVSFFGPGRGDPIALWTSFPADVVAIHEKEEDHGVKYNLTIPADVPVGIGAVRLITSAGTSSLQLLMIDDLPSIKSEPNNHTPQAAQLVTAPVAIDGACEPLASEYFRLHAIRGQKLSIEVVAARLGSKMDPLVRLLDSSGRELVYCDDAPGAGADSRFRYRFKDDGDYLIELRDVNYEGGTDYRYRLRLGDFPLISSVFPASARQGTDARFELLDEAGERLDPVSLRIPTGMPRTFVNVRYASGQGSGFAPIRCEQDPTLVAPEPSETRESAARVEVPVAIFGRLAGRNAQGYYRFSASKGEHLTISGQSRSLGSPCDLFIRVLKPNGDPLAQSKPSGPDEPIVDFTAPEDGDYLLSVEDLNRGGGPTMVYRLHIGPGPHRFDLGTESEKVDAARGKTFKLNVKCTRHDYTGPIRLALAGDAAGWEVSNATIAKGKTETDLEVKVPEDAPSGRPILFTVMGTADADGRDESRAVSTAPALQKLFPHLLFPPPELDGQIAVSLRQSGAPAK